ncbi:MAG TPA: cupin domain-containing protein [Thermomicrobiales bacterium]|nr:cupin domain-containing protein [Thermomicrobiales bacterium]
MSASPGQPVHVPRGQDRCGEYHNLGIGILTFKVATADSDGALLVVELAHHTQGGPARHLHHAQDEWFYVAEGAYVIEVGSERFYIHPGDAVFGPRGVPHTWAHIGETLGRIVFVVSPAGQLEAFFRALSAINAVAPQDPAFWPPFGMELVGPPIDLEAL